MGADLYIEPYCEENRKKFQPAFDAACAARDAYSKGIPENARMAQRKKEIQVIIQNNGHALKPSDRLTPDEERAFADYEDKFKRLAELQEEVEKTANHLDDVGYFGDSYNGSSLFWKLGLCWWAMSNVRGEKVKVQLVNSRGYITPKKAAMLLALVEALPITIGEEEVKEWAPGTTREDLVKYFTEKKARLIAFIKFAIEKKASIYASI